MANTIKRIVLMGPQGSGKSTQAEAMAEFLNVKIVTSSQVLREVVSKGSDMGQKIADIMKKGDLVPDEHMINLMLGELNAPHCFNGFILDGFPRNLTQAKALDDSCGVDKVFNVEISNEEAIKRISGRRVCSNGHVYHVEFNPPKQEGICDECGGELKRRADDEPEAIKNRLSIYRNETAQLLDYYSKQEKLVVFDGERPIEEISKEILDYLKANVG